MTQQRIAVIDYGMGNLHSVASALSHVAPTDDVVVTADPDIIASADRVIFLVLAPSAIAWRKYCG